jgi:hypothetical protein
MAGETTTQTGELAVRGDGTALGTINLDVTRAFRARPRPSH